jgi:hypothetical protein
VQEDRAGGGIREHFGHGPGVGQAEAGRRHRHRDVAQFLVVDLIARLRTTRRSASDLRSAPGSHGVGTKDSCVEDPDGYILALVGVRRERLGTYLKSRGLEIAMIAVLCGCQRDYRFHTVAVYEAPRGHYSIRIEGQGIVRAGHDISQQSFGRLTISPSSQPGPIDPVPVTVKLALHESQVLYDDEPLVRGMAPEPGARFLSRLLADRGYAVHADELEELVSATEGVLYGPKGTLVSGQSRCLRVLSTTFDR